MNGRQLLGERCIAAMRYFADSNARIIYYTLR